MMRISPAVICLSAILVMAAAPPAKKGRAAASIAGRPKATPAAVALSPVARALASAHAAHQAQVLDKFAPGPTLPESLMGQPAVIRVPLQNGDIADGADPTAFFSYEGGRLLLTDAIDDKRTDVGGKLRLLTFRATRRPERKYQAQNSYGAKTIVTTQHRVLDAIALIDAPTGLDSPYDSPGSIRMPLNNYWVRRELSGPEAKQLALDTDFVVEGTIAPVDGTRVTGCDDKYSEATIDSPLEIYSERCWIGLRVARIAYVRRSSEEVLQEWRAAAVDPK